jgi:hypothetical protein
MIRHPINFAMGSLLFLLSGTAFAQESAPADFFSGAMARGLNGDINSPTVNVDVNTGLIANTIATAEMAGVVTNDFGFISAGDAAASANRATGQLRAAAGGTSFNGSNLGLSMGYPADAQAQIGDTLFFTAAGAAPNGITTVGFSVQLHGTLSLEAHQTGFGSGQPGGLFAIYFGNVAKPPGFDPVVLNVHNSFSELRTWYGLPNEINETLHGEFSFSGVAATVPMYMLLYAHAQYGYADFSNTATLSFDPLSPGVSYTSASGDFLTRSVAVPGPIAGAGLPALLGLFGAWFYRRGVGHRHWQGWSLLSRRATAFKSLARARLPVQCAN